MKKIFFTATAVAALAISAPAFAQSTQGPQEAEFTVTGVNPPKCQINADDTTAELGTDEISNDQGRARNNVGRNVARALNELQVRAWCTGNSNSVNLTRTALVANGTDGEATAEGFNTAVIYDIAVEVPNCPNVGDQTEATENGPGAGGPACTRFGPDGRGERLRFSNYPLDDDSSAVTSAAPGEGARTAYSEDNSRLVAGDYSGLVRLTITPGQI